MTTFGHAAVLVVIYWAQRRRRMFGLAGSHDSHGTAIDMAVLVIDTDKVPSVLSLRSSFPGFSSDACTEHPS